MTLEQMASAIISNIGTGLKEVGNFAYSVDQIKDEISNIRSLMIWQLSGKPNFNPNYFAQTRTNIKLSTAVFPEEGMIESGNHVLLAKIPKLAMTNDNSSIIYLGPVDMSLNIKTYFSLSDLSSHKYTRTINNRPYAFIDLAQNADGDIPVYIANTGPSPFRYITVRAVFDDPVRLLQEDGYYIDDEEFPAPLAIQESIIDQLTNKFINYYKVANVPNEPNDQTNKS